MASLYEQLRQARRRVLELEQDMDDQKKLHWFEMKDLRESCHAEIVILEGKLAAAEQSNIAIESNWGLLENAVKDFRSDALAWENEMTVAAQQRNSQEARLDERLDEIRDEAQRIRGPKDRTIDRLRRERNSLREQRAKALRERDEERKKQAESGDVVAQQISAGFNDLMERVMATVGVGASRIGVTDAEPALQSAPSVRPMERHDDGPGDSPASPNGEFVASGMPNLTSRQIEKQTRLVDGSSNSPSL